MVSSAAVIGVPSEHKGICLTKTICFGWLIQHAGDQCSRYTMTSKPEGRQFSCLACWTGPLGFSSCLNCVELFTPFPTYLSVLPKNTAPNGPHDCLLLRRVASSTEHEQSSQNTIVYAHLETALEKLKSFPTPPKHSKYCLEGAMNDSIHFQFSS